VEFREIKPTTSDIGMLENHPWDSSLTSSAIVWAVVYFFQFITKIVKKPVNWRNTFEQLQRNLRALIYL